MVLYNVTVKINTAMQADWLEWMQETHIPEVLGTGCFKENRISRLVLPADPDNDGETYSLQYLCPDMETLQRYQKDFAPALQQAHTARYEGHFVAFRTVMEVVEISTVRYAENWEKN